MLLGVLFVPGVLRDTVGADDAQTPPPPPSVSASTVQSSESNTRTDSRHVIAEHLAMGRALLKRSDYRAAQDAFRVVLQIDATHSEALRLLTKAQKGLEAQQTAAERKRVRLQQMAQTLAVRVANDKAKALAAHATKAQGQLAHAREQQLKWLYNKGLALYRRGEWQSAVDAFQQMVLLDPAHPLVREAQRLIVRAEARQSEGRVRIAGKLTPEPHGAAVVPALERQLIAKRIEIETNLKYAKVAIKDRDYDLAMNLAQHVLVEDPQQREAQALLQLAQEEKLKGEEARLKERVHLDEQRMINDVIHAQVLPQAKQVTLKSPSVVQEDHQAMTAKLHEPISLDFNDVPLSDVLEFIADAASLSIIPSPQLDLKARRVSLKVTQLPLELALKYLMKSQALAYHIEQDAILIATEEDFSHAPLETRVFFLRNGLGPFALETAAVTPNPALTMEPVKTLIERSIPQVPESKLVIDERSGALIATNTEGNLRQIEQLLSQLDVTPTQVLIEARFVELTMTDLEQLGIESVLTGNFALNKTGAGNGTQGAANQLASGSGFRFPQAGRNDISGSLRESEGASLTLQGILTQPRFEAVLHALEESNKSKTLSAPRVTTLNNQTATIRVVEEFNYPTRYKVELVQFDINGDGDFNDAGETQFVNAPQDFQKRDIGILLNVTPSVGADGRMVTLVLAPEVSQFTQFRDLGGGVSLPEFTSNALTTSAVIEDGQTVVLGGLMKDTTTAQTDKIPILGDLPVVGRFFRQQQAASTRKNLLIFITAHVLTPRGHTT